MAQRLLNNKTMIYLPIEHIEQRYTTHLDRDIQEYLDRKKIQYTYLEPTVFSNEIKHGSFWMRIILYIDSYTSFSN